jgi:C-terminal processing protease CtpA/Prc
MISEIVSESTRIYTRWLDNANPAVKAQLVLSKRIATFARDVNKKHRLSKKQRLLIIDQAILLLDQTYAHLPLKRSIHAIDPIQRLTLFKLKVDQNGDEISETAFHRELQETFTSLRDVHTRYTLPKPFRGHVAYLPFLVEEYFETEHGEKKQKFMVSHLAEGFTHRSFERYVEILYWNGVPIRRAIEINGDRQPGSNIDARFARGLEALTIRELKLSLLPDEEWVTITYRKKGGPPQNISMEWLVVPLSAGKKKIKEKPRARAKHKLAVDRHRAAINQMRKILYAPKVVALEKRCAHEEKKWGRAKPVSPRRSAFRTRLPSVFRAEKTRNGEFAYIRIFTFDPDIDGVGPNELVDEFIRLLKRVPQSGLIIDLRGNSGGMINAGERLLQLFTPNEVEPEMFEFVNTPLNLRIAEAAPKDQDMLRFAKSIRDSPFTSAKYSAAFPLTPKDEANSIGQLYHGPVVLITDALCYSTTDIFTAGFQDNNIGVVLGTSGNTGAGGAQIIDHTDLVSWLGKDAKSPFVTLPRGAEFSVAIRRSLRVGNLSGRPLEDLGITPDRRYFMTERDLRDNRGLLNEAVKILKQMRSRAARHRLRTSRAQTKAAGYVQ